MGFHCKLSPDRRAMRTRPKQDEAVDLLDLLIEQVVDYAIFALDPAGNIASWNAGAERIKGYAPHEIIGKPYAVFFTEDDRLAGKPAHILAQARIEGRFQDEGWRVRKDGSRFWAYVVDHGAARRLRRAERLREDHARPDRTAARRPGGAARGGGPRRPPPGGAGPARGAAFARSAGPDPAQHLGGRDRASTPTASWCSRTMRPRICAGSIPRRRCWRRIRRAS